LRRAVFSLDSVAVAIGISSGDNIGDIVLVEATSGLVRERVPRNLPVRALCFSSDGRLVGYGALTEVGGSRCASLLGAARAPSAIRATTLARSHADQMS
jgi:hypothetical protein